MHQNPRTPLRHVIITGGAGFIGSQISARFLKEGCSPFDLCDMRSTT